MQLPQLTCSVHSRPSLFVVSHCHPIHSVAAERDPFPLEVVEAAEVGLHNDAAADGIAAVAGKVGSVSLYRQTHLMPAGYRGNPVSAGSYSVASRCAVRHVGRGLQYGRSSQIGGTFGGLGVGGE